MGIKSLVDWNRALIMVHLLQIIKFNSNSLWARWIKVTILKAKSFWQIPSPNDSSWIWKQVLKVRTCALQHLHYKIGTGQHVNFWYDPWLNGIAINPRPNLVSNSGIPLSATVSHVLLNSSWNLPISNLRDVVMLRRRIESLPTPSSTDDQILWDSWNIGNIKASHVWDSLRARQPPVSWSFILWNQLHVPRYSFILWLGLLHKLPTSDRTMHYTGRSMNCPLCQRHLESFGHLFFTCDYSTTILNEALLVGNWNNIPFVWDDLISFLTSYQGTKLFRNILCLSIAVSFYKI